MNKGLILLATLLTLTNNSFAFDNVKVSGFVTAAGGYIDNPEVGATSSNETPGYQDYREEHFVFQPDSLAAIQISSRVADDITVSIQMIGRFENQDSTVGLEWAYINYEVSNDFTIQMGRFRPSIYLYSNTIDVGLTYLWIAPPEEVYGQVPVTYTDGVNLLFNHTFENDMTVESSLYFSNVAVDVPFSGESVLAEFDNLFGGELSISNDYFKLRGSYSQAEFTTQTGVMIPTSPTTGIALDNTLGLQVDHAKSQFGSIGLTIDVADIILIGEYAKRRIDETVFAEDTTSYYGTLGYRMGDFTPHVTYSVVEQTYGEYTDADALTNALITAVRSSQANNSETITAGLRYEINARTALKFEYQDVTKNPQEVVFGTSILANEETNAKVYKIAVNVIF